MLKVVLDPGHGGLDTGAVANGLIERNLNLVVAKAAAGFLEISGVVDVLLTRVTNENNPSLTDRTNMANEWGANYFHSVHHNAGGGIGYEIIHSIHTESKGDEIAISIAKWFNHIGQIARNPALYSKENQTGNDYFAVIRQTSMPANISEFAFLDSIDHKNIDESIELITEGWAIANGILEAFGYNPVQIASNWATEEQLWNIEKGLSDGTNPQKKMTREQQWVMNKRLYDLIIKDTMNMLINVCKS